MIIGITPYLYFYDTMLLGFFKMEYFIRKLAITYAEGRNADSQTFSD